MQLEIFILSEVSQIKTNTIWYHSYVESKIWHKPIYTTETDLDIENRLVVVKGEEGASGMDGDFRVTRCKLLNLEWRSSHHGSVVNESN